VVDSREGRGAARRVGEEGKDYCLEGFLRRRARKTAPKTARCTTNAVAMLPTNAAPITTASIVLSSPVEVDFRRLETDVALPGS